MDAQYRVALLTAIVTICHSAAGAAQIEPPSIAYTGRSDGVAARAVRDQLITFARLRGLGMRDLADPSIYPDVSRAEELAKAIAHYAAFRYSAAIEVLDSLEATAAADGAVGLSRRELADLFVYRAMSKAETGASHESRDDLVRAASVYPSYQLDEARFRPSLRAAFERARAAVVAGEPALATVGFATGCIVHVDGARVAVDSPIQLRPGRHYLRARCAGFEPFASVLTLEAGQHQVAPTLVPLPNPRFRAIGEAQSGDAQIEAKLIWVNGSRFVDGRFDIELVDIASGETKRAWTLSVTDAKSAQQISDVLTSLLETEFSAPVPPAVVVIKERQVPWYQRKWVWAVAGATAAAVVILPFALRDTTPNGFDIVIEGVP